MQHRFGCAWVLLLRTLQTEPKFMRALLVPALKCQESYFTDIEEQYEAY